MWAFAGLLLLGTRAYGSAIPIATAASNFSTSPPSTITSPPTLVSGSMAVPINTCSFYNSTNSEYQWNDPWCSVEAGTVELVYWPTNDNYTRPSTMFSSELDYTFTSPSVYMVINTVFGWNPCGPLGPTTSNAVFAFDLTEVSTLVPYSEETATTRRSTRQLYLSDLEENCQQTTWDLATLTTATHPLKNDANRCNPSLVIPIAIKRWGYPYWKHCGNVGNKFGLFDPPYAIPTVDGLLAPSPVITTADSGQTSSILEQTTAPTVPSVHETSSSSFVAPEDPTSAETLPETTPAVFSTAVSQPSDPIASQPSGESTPSDGQTSVSSTLNTIPSQPSGDGVSSNDQTSVPQSESGEGVATQALGDPTTASAASAASVPASPVSSDNDNNDGGDQGSEGSDSNGDSPSPTAPDEIQFFGASVGPVSTVAKQIVSLGSAGLEVINDGSDGTSTYIVPAFGATVTGTNIAPASVAVYQGHTLTYGGSAVTVTSAVVHLRTGTSAPSESATSVPVVTGSSSTIRAAGAMYTLLVVAASMFLGAIFL